jgi:hypothetical protein
VRKPKEGFGIWWQRKATKRGVSSQSRLCPAGQRDVWCGSSLLSIATAVQSKRTGSDIPGDEFDPCARVSAGQSISDHCPRLQVGGYVHESFFR